MKEMHERAVKAAARYAEIKGYEVVDRDWASEALAGRIDLVAKDDGAYVFIEVTVVDRSEGGFAEGHLTREQLEVLAATWFADNAPDAEAPVRFDAIDMIVIGGSKALLRHHINKLGCHEDRPGRRGASTAERTGACGLAARSRAPATHRERRRHRPK